MTSQEATPAGLEKSARCAGIGTRRFRRLAARVAAHRHTRHREMACFRMVATNAARQFTSENRTR